MQGKRNAKKRSLVLLSADGSEEKVYKKTTVANPTSCFKKKKRPSNSAVARNIWAQLWPVCVWQFERTHLQMPGGLPGRGGEGREC